MSTANEILDFGFPHSSLQNSAKNIINKHIEFLFKYQIGKLNQITLDIGVSQYDNISHNLIPIIFKKFKSILADNGTVIISINSFSKKELRTLTYSLSYSENNKCSIISSNRELLIVLNTLEKFWKDNYIIGLFDCYLRNWKNDNLESFVLLGKFIIQKLSNYNGNRKILNSLKSNLNYFDFTNGDVLLGIEMAINKASINNACLILGLPESWYSYPYFSKVIVSFYDKNKEFLKFILEDIEKALIKHDNSSTSKKLISKLIIQTNSYEFEDFQPEVKALAFRLIGDPESSIKWKLFENATEIETKELNAARNILNEWITRQFINVFFEKCISDSRRRNFWLKYAPKITTFKVFGAKRTRSILKLDKRIEQFVDNRFSIVYSNRETAAFLFVMGDYKLIEFSDPGYAFYAYKKNNPDAPSFDVKMHRSVDDFRNGTLPLLVYRSGYYMYDYSDEGRLSHADGDLGWENVFDSWINEKIGINV